MGRDEAAGVSDTGVIDGSTIAARGDSNGGRHGCQLDFQAFDADNHYYEAEDAFTRHIDPQDGEAVHAVGRGRRASGASWSGGKINKFIPNPTFDPIAQPGSLEDYFRGRNTEGIDLKTMFGELDPLAEHPEYRDRDARLRLHGRAGPRAASCSSPRSASGMQEALKTRRPRPARRVRRLQPLARRRLGLRLPATASVRRAACITLADPDAGRRRARPGALAAGARIVVHDPRAGADRRRLPVSPGHPDYDPIWARLNEAGVPCRSTPGSAATSQYGKFWEPPAGGGPVRGLQALDVPDGRLPSTGASPTPSPPSSATACSSASRRCGSPPSRTAPCGCPTCCATSKAGYGKMPFAFERHPVEQFNEHVWVAPVLRGRHGAAQGAPSASITCCSAPTSPMPRACPSPPTS